MVYMLVNAVQELSDRNSALEMTVRQQAADYEARLHALETALKSVLDEKPYTPNETNPDLHK